MRLKDKVAIVTGGAHGMGEAEARLFAAEGAKVVVADILEHEAEIVAADIRAGGEEAMAAKIDVTSESEWVGLIAKAVATYGKLDILVNNAGISGSSVGDPDGLEGWHRIIAVNQTSVFLGTKLAASRPPLRTDASASPIPWAPPVTIATLSFSRMCASRISGREHNASISSAEPSSATGPCSKRGSAMNRKSARKGA